MEISADLVKELRSKTGAGIMDCKAALKETQGDLAKAVDWLRMKGLKTAEKRIGKSAKEGLVDSYIHPGGRIGVLLELNCETDFVARTPRFQELQKDLMLQVAASSPRYVNKEDVPADVLGKEREILRAQVAESGKPAAIIEKIVEGRLEKFYEEWCLLEQLFVKDQNTKIKDVVKQAIAQLGENIAVRRFTRYQLGQE
ncbi:MAG: translation elongation factor Ts [Candidatus Schekmanbacteria bacterium]|nr:translation elongation factor Ts [Candidatus Schekmanbacteria bacterium]